MDKELNLMYDFCDTIKRELEMLNEKIRRSGNEMSPSDSEHLRDLTQSLYNIKCIIAKIEGKEEGYSGAYYGNGGMSMRGESGRRGRSRDNMSRESSRESSRGYAMDGMGYTREDAREDFRREVESLMHRAPDEHSRIKMERFLNDMR